MYTDFYGLKEKPFNLTPSPRFLYLGETHKEALALLTYGVVERKGFILLTGEIGTGKTTMIQALLSNLEENCQVVHISNPLLSAANFIDYLAFSAFKRKVHFKSKAIFLIEFEQFLNDCLRHQKNFVLIIDEAQTLSFELLEEIRLLSNMETADEKLINIFLVGQPELNEKLRHPRCRPLLQRISIRHHIKALDLKGTQEYITARLKMAGAEDGNKIFPKNVINAVYEYSQGYPRMINILSDNALLLGYSKGIKKITPAIVRECCDDMKLGEAQPEKSEESKEPYEVKRIGARLPGSYWKWAAVLVAVLFAVFANTSKGHDVIGRMASLITTRFQEAPRQVEKQELKPLQQTLGSAGNEEKQDAMRPAFRKPVEKLKGPDEPEEKIVKGKTVLSALTATMEPAEKEEHPTPEEAEALWTTIVVREGDTLTELALNIYGQADENILDVLQKHNPELENINRLDVGQEIVFPPLSKSSPGPVFTVHITSFNTFKPALDVFQKMMTEGYEAYIMPVNDIQKGKFFRVTLGSFKNRQEAKEYAAAILQNGVSDYAKPMRLEMR